ncbi:MAG TPA: AAA family ATPase, partial [Anaeromyxobacteraceae bacterium]|nr:AAA family ATPase [Anaeromyxobacteraceae bacterium]
MPGRTLVLYGLSPSAQPLAGVALELGVEVVIAGSDAAEVPPPNLSLGLVSVDRDPDYAFRVAAAFAKAGARVVVQSASKDADLILRALRSGAHEFVVDGDADGLKRALSSRPGAEAEVHGKVTALFGSKGGLGATTLAANLAGTIAKRGARVCLVDLDAALGGVPALLDLTPTYTLLDVVANMRRMDRELLDQSLPKHASGVAIVAPGEDLEAAERIDATVIAGLLAFLRRHFDAVVVDGLGAFDERTLAALDASDRILLVVTQEVASVRNAQRCLEVFDKLGYARGKVQVVLNRYQKSASITSAIVEETLGFPLAATVANDFASLSRAVGKGVLVSDEAPRAQIARDL